MIEKRSAIIESGGQYRQYSQVRYHEKYEVRNYLLRHDAFGNVFLVDGDPFTTPNKLYDVDQKLRQMILKSFNRNQGNTGVLLEGYKGQGKSVTAKLLCQEANLPVIIIDQPIPADVDFISFLAEIAQPYILLVDEFEKTFRSSEGYISDNEDSKNHTQYSFLGIMDGAISNEHKKLFVLTTNEEIDDKFLNRPSRVRFRKTYQFMSKELFEMITDDLLEDPSFKEDLIAHLPLQEATIDLLTSVIREVNIQGAPYSEFKSVFNHSSRRTKYQLFWRKSGTEDWKTAGNLYLTSEPIRNTRYIDSLQVDEMHAVDEDGCIFSSYYVHNNLPAAVRNREKSSLLEYKVEKSWVMRTSDVL